MKPIFYIHTLLKLATSFENYKEHLTDNNAHEFLNTI